jgi:type IV pilus assembly protein PilY1
MTGNRSLAHDAVRRRPAGRAIAGVLAIAIALQPLAATAATVDLSPNPMAGKNPAKPNIIFGYDDSGSMDWETIIKNTNEGTLWHSSSSSSPFWNTTTTTTGGGKKGGGGTTITTTAINNGETFGTRQYAYLFPNGSTNSSTGDVRRYGDGDRLHAIPPTPEFAFARSFDYNPLYYNPAVRYVPWTSAWIDGALRTFTNATPSAVRSHPYYPTSGTAVTMNVGATVHSTSPADDWTFRYRQGMVIPVSVPGFSEKIYARQVGSTTWSEVTSAITVGTTSYDVMIPYLPATYWKVRTGETACPNTATLPAADCVVAYDGKVLERVAITTGKTFTKATGRTDCAGASCTYAEELQNFANWFQYYRKRRLAMASGMGQALDTVQGIRADAIYFNGGSWTRPDAQMYDFSVTDAEKNGKAVIGKFYASDAQSGTPIRSIMKHIGDQYARTGTGAPIQYSCQRNASFIATDGYNTDTSTTAPSYSRDTWVSTAPYTDLIDNSLADIASAYYTNNPRPDLTTGQLTPGTKTSNFASNLDNNTNLHVNQYAITLGALGTIFGTSSPSATNPWVNPPTWPAVDTSASIAQIDDLFHATINGRGDMYNAYNATDVANALKEVVKSMLTSSGSDAGVGVSAYNLSSASNTAYVSSFNAQNGWTGELKAFPVNLTTGEIDTSDTNATWKAQALLDAKTPSSRLIASYDGTSGVRFQASGSNALPATLRDKLALTATSGDGDDVLAFLRGDRSKEGVDGDTSKPYRKRSSVLGDIVSAEPVYVDGVVYQPANDGMLHAFDAATGEELWAYIPYNVIPVLKNLASKTYSHRFFVDGTPVVQNTGTRTVLVGGLRGGGAGYYAIDITDPRPNNEGTLAGKVLWEFPKASTSSTTVAQIGMSYGKPVIVKLADGTWAALLTSGYNNSSDQNHLHVVNLVTGALIRTITTPTGYGLAHVAAWVANPVTDPTVDFVYGGDLTGSLWRFDLRATDPASWSVVKLAQFPSTQPITATPELTKVKGQRLVIVGTGKMLGDSDTGTTDVQSVYGIVDDTSSATPTIADARATGVLYKQTLTIPTSGFRTITSEAIDYSVYKGWYFDLPAGERVSTDSSIAFGTMVFTTNLPNAEVCQSESYLYAINVETGGQINFTSGTTPWTGRRVAYTLSSRPVLVTLPNGQLLSMTHKSDASVSSTTIPLIPSGSLRRHGWREILR